MIVKREWLLCSFSCTLNEVASCHAFKIGHHGVSPNHCPGFLRESFNVLLQSNVYFKAVD